MAQHYSDETREDEPTALPDVETFKGYQAECRSCGQAQPMFPDYYGLLYQNEPCTECGSKDLRVTDTKIRWYYWFCFPGCLPDSDPIGPFDSEADALADARDNG